MKDSPTQGKDICGHCWPDVKAYCVLPKGHDGVHSNGDGGSWRTDITGGHYPNAALTSKMRLNPWYVPYAFANAEMTQYPLNCNIDPETGKIKPPGMRVYMADQADAEIERLRAALDYIVKRRLILGANGEFLERDTAPVAGYGGFYEHEQMAYVQPTLAEAISRATTEVSGWACANSHMFGTDPTCPVCSSGETNPKRCARCGVHLQDAHKYCSECGQGVGQEL